MSSGATGVSVFHLILDISTCLILFKSLWSQWYQYLSFFNHSELQVSVSYFYNHSGATAYLSLSFKKHCRATGIRLFLLKSKWNYCYQSLSFKKHHGATGISIFLLSGATGISLFLLKSK